MLVVMNSSVPSIWIGSAIVSSTFCQEHCEFVAAHARDRILFAQRSLQPRGDRLEQLVAGRMAQRVVDDFEAIEVEKHHRQRMLHPPRVRQRDREPVAEEAAIRQAGQRIVIGLILDLLFHPLALGDVARDADNLANFSCERVAHAAAGGLEPHQRAVFFLDAICERGRTRLMNQR
jgi:hypothetical protein